MYKKSRLARLKQRVHGKKQLVRKKMARQLLSGTLSLAQVEERDPEGLSRVLRTVAYLNESEGSQIPSAIAPAVSHALAPATFGVSIPQVSRSLKVPAERKGSTRVPKSAVASESTEPLAQEVSQTPSPRRRGASSKSETPGPVEMEGTPSVTDASKKKTTTRGTKKSSSDGNAKSPAVAKEKTSATNRRRANSTQDPSTTGAGETPVKPRQSKRQSSKPKADGEN